MSDAHLHLEGYSTSLFNDGSYRWFDEKQYRICSADATTTDRELLANLIGQPSYDRTSPLPSNRRSGSSQEKLASHIKRMEQDRAHGPYWVRCITPDRFEAVDLATAKERLTVWGSIDSDGIPQKGHRELERLEEIAQAASGLHWLRDLDAECVAPWNYFGAWAELVIVDRKRDELLLVVASSD